MLAILTLLGRIPVWVWLAAAVTVWGFNGYWQADRLRKQQQEVELESSKLAEKARLHAKEQARQIESDFRKRMQDASAVSSTLRNQLGKLREQASGSIEINRDAIAICGIDGERGRVLERLLNESAELAIEGAERVGKLSAKTTALQDYIERVCVNKNADR
jgi:F0F1-type ATP synthase membrane subunit b/b'